MPLLVCTLLQYCTGHFLGSDFVDHTPLSDTPLLSPRAWEASHYSGRTNSSGDFSLLVAFLLVTFSWLFRGFFVALLCLEKQCLGLFRGFFVAFAWLFRGPRFGQNLCVLALEKSSENSSGAAPISGPKKPWQPQTWQDLTWFSPLDFSLLSPDFRGLVLLNCT